MKSKHVIILKLILFLTCSIAWSEQSNFNRSRVSHSWNSSGLSSGYDTKAFLGNTYRGLLTLQYDYVQNPYKLIDNNGNALTNVVGDFSRIRLGYALHLNRAWSLGVSIPFDNIKSKPFEEGGQNPNILSDPLSQSYSGFGDIELSLKRRIESLSLRWNWVLESILTVPPEDEGLFNKDGDFSLALRMSFSRYMGRENNIQLYGYFGGRYAPGSKLRVSPLYFPFESEKRLELGLGIKSQLAGSWGLYSELNGFLSLPFESGQNPIELSVGIDRVLGKLKIWKVYAGIGLEGLAGNKFSNDERYHFGLKRQIGRLSQKQVQIFSKSDYPVYSSSYDALIDSVHSETSLVKKIVGKAKSVYFVTNSAKLSPEGKLEIIDIVSHLIKHKERIKAVHIEGYADSVGYQIINLKLSKHRAEAVRKILIEYGVPANILKIGYHGDTKSKNEADDFSKFNNRKVEIKIKSLEVENIKIPLKKRGVFRQLARSPEVVQEAPGSYVRHSLFPKPFLLNNYLVENFTILTEDNLTWGAVSKRIYGSKTYRDLLKSLNYNRSPALGDVIYFPSLTGKKKSADRFYFAKW